MLRSCSLTTAFFECKNIKIEDGIYSLLAVVKLRLFLYVKIDIVNKNFFWNFGKNNFRHMKIKNKSKAAMHIFIRQGSKVPS